MRAVSVIRTLNKWVLGASALLVLVAFWNRNDLPRNIAFRTELQDAPRQTRTADPPFTVDYAGVTYRVEPQFAYDLYGMIVSYRLRSGSTLIAKPCIVVPAATRMPIAAILRSGRCRSAASQTPDRPRTRPVFRP